MSNTVLVKNTENGKTYNFPKHLLTSNPQFEEVSIEAPKTYKELKDEAKDKGLEFKGNIKKEDLEKLLSE